MIELSIFANSPLDSDSAIERALHGIKHERDGHGRPFAPDRPELRISVSHAVDLVLVAVARGCRVGVDVEPLCDRGITRLPDHALSERERLDFAGDPRLETFLSYWTRKEALLKAVGLGLAIEPSLIELPRHGPRVAALPEVFGAAERWSAAEIPLAGCVAALAAEMPSPAVRGRLATPRNPEETIAVKAVRT